MKALIIGGTRNLGPSIAEALMQGGYSVAVFHRGVTPGTALPQGVERLHGDRGDPKQLTAALGTRNFDAVVDTTVYNGPDARAAAELLQKRAGRYIMLSTGQVYLVRAGLRRPYVEDDYAGATIPPPSHEDAYEYGNWSYGIDKRAAEDALMEAWQHRKFPAMILRLPMVNSERDHYDRLTATWLDCGMADRS